MAVTFDYILGELRKQDGDALFLSEIDRLTSITATAGSTLIMTSDGTDIALTCSVTGIAFRPNSSATNMLFLNEGTSTDRGDVGFQTEWFNTAGGLETQLHVESNWVSEMSSAVNRTYWTSNDFSEGANSYHAWVDIYSDSTPKVEFRAWRYDGGGTIDGQVELEMVAQITGIGDYGWLFAGKNTAEYSGTVAYGTDQALGNLTDARFAVHKGGRPDTGLSSLLMAVGGAGDVEILRSVEFSGKLVCDATQTISGSSTAVTDNTLIVFVDSTSGDSTAVLPVVASHTGRVLWIKRIDTTGNAATIDGNGSETIDGGLTVGLLSYDSITLYCNGSAWFII